MAMGKTETACGNLLGLSAMICSVLRFLVELRYNV